MEKTWQNFVKLAIWLISTFIYGATGLFFIFIINEEYCSHFDIDFIGWLFVIASIIIGFGLYPYREN